MNKNLAVPIIVIALALGAGFWILSSGQTPSQSKLGTGQAGGTSVEAEKNLRIAEFSIPGMSCPGCVASIEAYIGAMDGVKKISVSLSEQGGKVVYDPAIVGTDEILANTIFNIYPATLISDDIWQQ